MSKIDKRIKELGYSLPPPFAVPDAMKDYMAMVRVIGNRCVVAGHASLTAEGSIAMPLGKVGTDLTLEQGSHAAHLTALAMLSALKAELGSLDRISAWIQVLIK